MKAAFCGSGVRLYTFSLSVKLCVCVCVCVCVECNHHYATLIMLGVCVSVGRQLSLCCVWEDDTIKSLACGR